MLPAIQPAASYHLGFKLGVLAEQAIELMCESNEMPIHYDYLEFCYLLISTVEHSRDSVVLSQKYQICSSLYLSAEFQPREEDLA